VSCQKVFGGTEYAGCNVPGGIAALTGVGSITALTGEPTIFIDTARIEAADYWAMGTIAFTSGANAGLKPMEIKSFLAGGTIEVYEPFHYPIVVTDAYVITPGCRKRQIDCSTKWNNMPNFGGFSHIPTGSQYAQRAGSHS
jgi:hypothetical protein